MLYFCQCGAQLQKTKVPEHQQVPKLQLSYKVLKVRTQAHYKCPNGCELVTVTSIGKAKKKK